MARSEARIFTSIWRDPEFLSLAGTAQRLYVFLLSQDDLAYCGVMPLRPQRWVAKAAHLSLGEIEQDLKSLAVAERTFIVTDHDTGELLVRSLMRHDGIWRQPNLLKLARESAEQVESRRIRGVLLAELRRLPLSETGSDLVKTLVADFITDLEKGGEHPTPYPAGYGADMSPAQASASPTGEPCDNTGGDPSEDDYARALGTGDRYSPKPGFPEPLYPDPQLLLPPKSGKNATRLSDNFVLDAEMIEWASTKTPHVDPAAEFERFRDYWLAKPGRDGRKLDWLATWRNWMRNAEDRQGPRYRPARPQTDALFDDAARRIAARREILP